MVSKSFMGVVLVFAALIFVCCTKTQGCDSVVVEAPGCVVCQSAPVVVRRPLLVRRVFVSPVSYAPVVAAPVVAAPVVAAPVVVRRPWFVRRPLFRRRAVLVPACLVD